MENIVKSAAFMDLYNQQYPAAPELPPIITEVAQPIITSPSNTSPSAGNNGKLRKSVLIIGLAGLVIYIGYRWHRNYQLKKDKQVYH